VSHANVVLNPNRPVPAPGSPPAPRTVLPAKKPNHAAKAKRLAVIVAEAFDRFLRQAAEADAAGQALAVHSLPASLQDTAAKLLALTAVPK
jgi:hypothetical protein